MISHRKNWKSIANHAFQGAYSDVQCLHRWQKVLKPGLVKGPWTKEVCPPCASLHALLLLTLLTPHFCVVLCNFQEDKLVVDLVRVHGLKKWSFIAGHLKGRLGKQCRER